MKPYRGRARPRVQGLKLLGLLILLAGSSTVLDRTRVSEALPCRDAQIRAAIRMSEAFSVLSERSADRAADPNRTGVIGVEWSELTTTVGSLESKRTSTNPDFAALLVRLLDELDPDRRVVLTLSGSFPALNIASIVACEELGLELLIISSVGASSFGANRPEMTWLDMESLLAAKGVISHATSIASLGGEGDLGDSFFDGGRELALAAIERSGFTALVAADGDEQRRIKMEVIRAFRPGALINVGGNQLAVGRAGHLLAPGVSIATSLDTEDLGIAGWFLERRLPVVNLLGVRDLALRYGLPLDPIPLPPVGESGVYRRSVLHRGWAAAAGALLVLFTAYMVRSSRRDHFRQAGRKTGQKVTFPGPRIPRP